MVVGAPKLFKKLIADGFDILTYRKGKFRRVVKKHFSVHESTIDGRKRRYILADREVRLLKQTLRLRQVTRLGDDGHQIGIVTSRRDLSASEVVYRLTERWRQENFFKYLRIEYALDALVDYGVESADEDRMVPNPERRKLNSEIQNAYAEVNQLAAEYGVEALTNREQVRRTTRGFKIANAPLSERISKLADRIMALEKKRSRMPARVPVQQVVKGEVIKLSVERKHLTDLIKMVAYQAECDLLRLVAPHYRRAEDEGRALIRSAFAAAGDIEVDRRRTASISRTTQFTASHQGTRRSVQAPKRNASSLPRLEAPPALRRQAGPTRQPRISGTAARQNCARGGALAGHFACVACQEV